MRALEIFLWFMVAVGLLCWFVFYTWMMGMACAFGSLNSNCRTTWPWELDGESFLLFVLIPASLVIGLAGAALLLGGRGGILGKLMILPAGLILLLLAVFSVL